MLRGPYLFIHRFIFFLLSFTILYLFPLIFPALFLPLHYSHFPLHISCTSPLIFPSVSHAFPLIFFTLFLSHFLHSPITFPCLFLSSVSCSLPSHISNAFLSCFTLPLPLAALFLPSCFLSFPLNTHFPSSFFPVTVSTSHFLPFPLP